MLPRAVRSCGCLCVPSSPHCVAPVARCVVVQVRRRAALWASAALYRRHLRISIRSIDQPMPLTALVSVPSGSRSGCGLPPGLARFRASPRFTVPSRRAACLPVCLLACLCCRDCGWFVPLRRLFVCLFVCLFACVLAFCALLPFALYGRYVFRFLRGRPFHLAQGSAADSLARVWCGGGAKAACCRRRSVRALDDARGGVPVRP